MGYEKDKQIQMSNILYNQCISFMQKHNMDLKEFAEFLHTESYMLGKVMDRNIKMYNFYSTLEKIAKKTFE